MINKCIDVDLLFLVINKLKLNVIWLEFGYFFVCNVLN